MCCTLRTLALETLTQLHSSWTWCVLQCTVVCCSVLQCVAKSWCLLQCTVVWCSVLQCVAESWCLLQCVAVCCSASKDVEFIWCFVLFGIPYCRNDTFIYMHTYTNAHARARAHTHAQAQRRSSHQPCGHALKKWHSQTVTYGVASVSRLL